MGTKHYVIRQEQYCRQDDGQDEIVFYKVHGGSHNSIAGATACIDLGRKQLERLNKEREHDTDPYELHMVVDPNGHCVIKVSQPDGDIRDEFKGEWVSLFFKTS